MGDRCYIGLVARRADLEAKWPQWKKNYNSRGTVDGYPDLIWIGFEEMNYGSLGCYPELAGVPFIGDNSAGYEYGAAELVNDGTEDTWRDGGTDFWPTGHDRDGYVFHVDPDGQPLVTDEWRKWWALRQRVHNYLYNKQPL